MQVRSWMAVLVLVAGSTCTHGLRVMAQSAEQTKSQRGVGKDAKPQEPAQVADERPQSPDSHAVKLNLMIAGLGRAGCDVDVKPGNRNCRFRPQSAHVGSDGAATFLFRDVELRGADHNCMFSITIRESGRDSRTVYRGVRLSIRGQAAAPARSAQPFTCYVNSPSKLAGLERMDRVRQ